MHSSLFGLVRLVTSALVAGGMSSPMSWSPDGQWLSYTVAPGSESDARTAGWLFDTSRGRAAAPEPRGPSEPKASAGPISYRIWATHRDAEPSVLIEESAWPLTAPCWSPIGRSVVFGRFVPESMGAHQPGPRGRLEVVIQDGLDRKRILLTVPEFELDAEARADFPHCRAAWSPDGQYLALPRPGRPPAILILKADSRRILQTLDHLRFPVWSPDGSKLACIRDDEQQHGLQLVERRGPTFRAARPVVPLGPVTAAPSWSGDGRAIFAVLGRSAVRSQELVLAHISPETGDHVPVLPLATELLRRGAGIRGVALDFDRDQERCFFAVDIASRDADLVWSVPRERVIYKRFAPLDASLRIGSIAASPDGRAVALRFEPPGTPTLPAIYDTATDRTSLVVPDAAARGAWLAVLAGTARALLLAGLPAPVVADRVADRPTLLPLPGELPAHQPLSARLARLGRFGADLCERPRRDPAAPDEEDAGPTITAEDRLFFDYLRGDFAAAAAALEALEPRIDAPDRRLALLSLRAQILWLQGERTRARAVVDYLLAVQGGPIRRIEETPRGPVITLDPDPRQTWARYLAARLTAGAPPPSPPRGEPPDGRIDPPLPDPFVAPEFPPLERGGLRPIPFVPIHPGLDPRPIREGIDRPARLEVAPQPPPPPRPIEPMRRRPR